MAKLDVRKTLLFVEDTLVEGGKPVAVPVRKVAVAAAIRNPFAGKYIEDLSSLFDIGEQLGDMLGRRAVEALGPSGHTLVQSYGKAAIVGMDGEIEHCAAIMHPKLGRPFRIAVNGGKAIIPSATKRGAPGTAIDVPLHYKDDEWQFANFDSFEVRVPDAPGADEIVVVVAVTNVGRPHARIGASRVSS